MPPPLTALDLSLSVWTEIALALSLVSSRRSPLFFRFSHSFTHFSSQPYDHRIKTAMIETSKDLLRKFQPSAVYTASDEISLLFPSLDYRINERNEEGGGAKGPPSLLFRNSVQKIVSLTAGFCSTRFVYNLQTFDLTPQQKEMVSEKRIE